MKFWSQYDFYLFLDKLLIPLEAFKVFVHDVLKFHENVFR